MIVMKITIDNNRFMELQAAPDDLDKIDDFFTYQDYSECYVYGKFKKEKIKNISYLIRKKKYPTLALLPIGFKDELHRWLHLNKAKYKFYEKRKIKQYNFSDDEIRNILYSKDNPIILYDYQVDAVKTLLNETTGIIKAATGAGKTEIMSAYIKLTQRKTLILFKKIELANQTKKRMKKSGIDVGIVQGKNIDENHSVVCVTVQSAHKLNKNDYEMVIVDESHNASANSYQDIISGNIFQYRFGFSATPFTKDKFKNSKIKSWLGNIIYKIDPDVLVKNGTLAKPYIHIYDIKDCIIDKNGHDFNKDIDEQKWPACEKNGIVKNKVRNNKIKDIALNNNGQILILVKYVDHGKALEKLIPGSVFIYGETKVEEREKILNKFEAGEEFVLIASTILDEGIDLKNVNRVIMGGGGVSYVKILQRIGRGMRILKDSDGNIIKSEVHIYDFFDKTNKILERHSKNRISVAKQTKYEIIYED